MTVDRAGIMWIATSVGLNRFDPETEKFILYTADKNRPGSLNDNAIRSIHETKSGNLWVGTTSGLNRYSKETDDFTVYEHDPANPESLSKGDILAIFEGDNEQLWVGGTGELNKFNQKTSRFHRFRHEVNNPHSISNDEILSIFEDKNKTLWIGTRRGGQDGELNRYDIEKGHFEIAKKFGKALVYSVFEDREGILWFGTLGGLLSFDRETDRVTNHTKDPSSFDPASGNVVSTSIITFEEDGAGNLFYGTIGNGMGIYDRTTAKFKSFQFEQNNFQSLASKRVYAIVEDTTGTLWIGTGDGLDRFDPVTRSFRHYKHDPNNPKSISADDLGTIYEDRNGTMWFGTTTGGLNRFDRDTDTFTAFTERDGLPSKDVFAIMEDDQGNLWLCTDRGLARFNIETKSVRTFNVNDGVPNNPFDNKTAFKNREGKMYFGGQDGFVKFDPKDFTDSDFIPPVYLTDIRILEHPLKTMENVALMKDLNLSWRDYVVSFDFAALDYTDPKKLQYQWKLDGFDPDWINGGTRRTATYTNLPGGDYVLKVKATNVDGVWTGEAVNLAIHVQPPFYRTFWFLTLTALVIGVLVWLAYRYRINQLRAVSEAQTRFTQQLITSQEAERKRIAAELHDGLGQSLVVIKNRAMLGLSKGEDRERVAKELGSISESASHALDEVREITNNLRPQLLDRLGLTKALNAMLKKTAGVIEIECEIDQIDGFFTENEEISIYRIVQESVNNIIKHSNASNARVKIERKGAAVSISIEDNGSGFDPGDTRLGLGLVGLRERSQLLGGELTIHSRSGEGTKIELLIDKRN
jgi:signal transduction histidine kinase/ligand-binding sensor domain-containing protein